MYSHRSARVDLAAYREYMQRIDEADTVGAVHAIAREAEQAHPGDPQAAAVERACFARAEALISRGRLDLADDWRERAAKM